MPAKSRNQQIAMAIAEHDPAKLYARNAGLTKMSHQQLHDFASTPRKGLPQRVPMARGGLATVPMPKAPRYGPRGTGYAVPPYHREVPQYMTENLAPQFSTKERLNQYAEGGVAGWGNENQYNYDNWVPPWFLTPGSTPAPYENVASNTPTSTRVDASGYSPMGPPDINTGLPPDATGVNPNAQEFNPNFNTGDLSHSMVTYDPSYPVGQDVPFPGSDPWTFGGGSQDNPHYYGGALAQGAMDSQPVAAPYDSAQSTTTGDQYPYVGINDPAYNQPTDAGLGSGLSDTAGTNIGGTDYGNLPISNLSARPLDTYLQAALAPSNVPGSGGPTQRGVGMIAGVLGNAAFPGLGTLVLSPLARLITRGIQGAGQNKAAAAVQQAQPVAPPSAGVPRPPQGLGLWGTNPGLNPTEVKWATPERNFGDPISNSIDPNSPGMYGGGPLTANPSEPGWIGGTPFGSSVHNLSMALPGSFSGLGQGSAGQIPFFSRMANRYAARGDPSMGFGYGSALSQYALQSRPGVLQAQMPSFASIQGYLRPNTGFTGSAGSVSHFGPQGRQMGQFAGGGVAEDNYSGGGMVQPAAQPLQGMGTDTVPAALTPGEVVLNKGQQAAVQPRPGMAKRLRPDQLAAIAVAMRNRR